MRHPLTNWAIFCWDPRAEHTPISFLADRMVMPCGLSAIEFISASGRQVNRDPFGLDHTQR